MKRRSFLPYSVKTRLKRLRCRLFDHQDIITRHSKDDSGCSWLVWRHCRYCHTPLGTWEPGEVPANIGAYDKLIREIYLPRMTELIKDGEQKRFSSIAPADPI